ncbi:MULTISPECIES: hypothetical protein [Bradyrhizobium]|uniref:hypothetical protein n=1 Tax=Bradyrhizobium TaxID=374 RepID=UPI0018F59990|nr:MULTISPECIES: hypothetical protein [Bradyrhizobium]UWU93635.1 hypothetical protein N2604_06985 [Bradyrhizobium sp. CB1015]
MSPLDISPGVHRAKPYVSSDAEIDALLTAALALAPADGLRRWSYHTLSGCRHAYIRGDGLERDDVDLDAGVLTVRLTKFGKSPFVPLHPTTRTGLRHYVNRRERGKRTRSSRTTAYSPSSSRS